MALDTKAWLKDLGFSDDEITTLAPQFESRASAIEKGQLRQVDYSRHMNDLKAKNDQLTQEMTDWAAVQATTQNELTEKQNALDALERDKFELTRAVTRLAEQAGVDPSTILKTGTVEPPVKPTTPAAFDPKPIVDMVGGVTTYLLNLSTELPMIAQDHFDLTGERFDSRKFRQEIEARAAKKEYVEPYKLWEELYDIPAKREAQAKTKYDNDIKAAETRGREAARSEAAIPGAQPTGTHAPVFHRPEGSGPKLQRPGVGRHTADFAQSLAKGTYRNGGTGQPGSGTGR